MLTEQPNPLHQEQGRGEKVHDSLQEEHLQAHEVVSVGSVGFYRRSRIVSNILRFPM